MEVEHRRKKEIEEHAQRRKDRELECENRTAKKALKRRSKKEKAKMLKEAQRESKKLGVSVPNGDDGTFLEKVRAKYGDDVLIDKNKKKLESIE